MPTLLDKVRTALKRPTPTPEQLSAAVDDARRAEADALVAVDKAQAVVTAGFMDDAAKRQADRNALAAAREGAEDAGLVRAEAERRHVEAIASGEQARRRMLYDSAKAEADAAALALSRTYPKLAAGMVTMLRDLATAQAAVALVNAQLPDGAEPLVDPEMSARGVPGAAREIISEEDVELWSRLDMHTPVDAEFQDGIYSLDKADGTPSGRGRRPDDLEAAFILRRFRKVIYRDSVNGDYPLPLAASLQLPGVRGSNMLWGDTHPVYAPGLSMTLLGQAEPGAVLSRLAQIDATATATPTKAERPLQVEWTLLGDAVPVLDKPVLLDAARRGQPSGTGSRFAASPFATPGSRSGARAGGRR